MTAHPITQNEETDIILIGIMYRKNGILLMRIAISIHSLPAFPDASVFCLKSHWSN